ncbi:tyrosine-type recombinase/integrase [Rhizobium mongolense]
MDDRYPTIRLALGTRDLGEARAKRDAHERADDLLWASLSEGGDQLVAEARYKSAVARATALGFTYRHLSAILLEESGADILTRLRALQDTKPSSPQETAILGGIAPPPVSLRRAFDIYVEEIVASEIIGKSEGQRELWLRTKKRAITCFEEVCGERNLMEITREDALKFYNWWRERIAPKSKKPTHSASTGNRDVGNLRVLYDRYCKYIGMDSFKNPFDGLSFAEKFKKTRPPFPVDWIVSRILKPGALATLNDEARAIVLIMTETGCRPSEIANLVEGQILLSDAVPHIMIEPRSDPDDPREIKTESSIRAIPLVGVALETMKKFPRGFSRYRDKETHMSNTLNKYFRENGLFPTKEHVIYSLRHSFEDRMKVGGFDTELRMMLMGHMIDRPKYGAGGTLEWKQTEMTKIALPFDASIV